MVMWHREELKPICKLQWVYRNYFMREHGAHADEICIICSSDCHYSMDKGANILMLDVRKVQVDEESREVLPEEVEKVVQKAKEEGKKYFIVICNMMTTMFGSVDDVNTYTSVLKSHDCIYKVHIDGAFGGFYYPFSEEESQLNFSNPEVSSITLDAHKMAQAPYGTGIFLVRKGLIQYANTDSATYVEGEDYTMIGSRSGANAVATWMILVKSGPYGWWEKVFVLQQRTDWIQRELNKMGIDFFRHPKSNIITIKAEYMDKELAAEYGLVPDNHKNPKWYKIVVMDHVTLEKVVPLLNKLKELRS